MISAYKKRKLTFITIVYWFMLLFIVAAWVWWFISLENQNNQMLQYRLTQLNKDDIGYVQKSNSIKEEHKRKTIQYISEGITFLLVTLVGAVFVYRSVRKQFLLSKQQQNFMMAVTHELKTPIAVVNLNLETLQKRKLDEEKQKHIIQSTLQEADRLNDLTTNILVTSQLESHYVPDKEQINFSMLCEKSVTDFINHHPQRSIIKNIEENVFITGEKLLLQLLVNNLLDNAQKYSSKEKNIYVDLSNQQHKIVLKIIDEGSGISDEEKKKVFEKFYRSGNEAMRKTKGTGLGLYLCKRIAESHKAKIKITDNKPTGSIFIVEFNT
ncbi:MAG TPA: HAMP domain-containing sensor histidine kinase [Parafilimonas sp.]|nr:HAMP domain-containing sensor histidine kinase [Parafilimonas sp.]